MEERPLILITNDDGVYAKGINELIEVIRLFGDIVVVAPDSPRSGMGHAITVDHPPSGNQASGRGWPFDLLLHGDPGRLC